jgi:hypothetical protein
MAFQFYASGIWFKPKQSLVGQMWVERCVKGNRGEAKGRIDLTEYKKVQNQT